MSEATAPPGPGLVHGLLWAALWLFLVPISSLVVFETCVARLDHDHATHLEEALGADTSLDPAQRQGALEFIRKHPRSEIVASDDPEMRALARGLSSTVRGYYDMLRWLIRTAWLCILSGLGLLALVGLSIPLASRSQYWHSLSLLAGWYSIRPFLTLQVVAQGFLFVGLSFWITALLFRSYSLELVMVSTILACGGIAALLTGIFVRVDGTLTLDGELLSSAEAPAFWQALGRVAEATDTDLPAQIVVGIDDNFFVTECPVSIGGRKYRGKTLYVSLSLLRTLSGPEAESILAHEMAHFSGEDTAYTRRTGPLFHRFDVFLAALHESLLAGPVRACARLMRRIYWTSLFRISRDREFRADGIAAAVVDPSSVGDALVRTMAYSAYRRQVESTLFATDAPLADVGIGRAIEAGYREFAPGFAERAIGDGPAASHPFDTHPRLDQRLRAIGRPTDVDSLRAALSADADGAWYGLIPDAPRREAALWARYESRFRTAHDRSLVFRLLPATPEEAAIVAAAFPTVTLPAKGRTSVTIDHEKVVYETWPEPVHFADLVQIVGRADWGTPVFDLFFREGGRAVLPLSRRQRDQQRVIDTLTSYWDRRAAAAAHHADPDESEEASPDDDESADDHQSDAGDADVRTAPEDG